LLERYSGAEFRTDATTYQPTPGAHQIRTEGA
jgi:hypothetical protein